MQALVVYESMFGNTAAVAKAIADGLGSAMDVRTCPVHEAPRDPDEQIDLVVAGGPTHAFSMSRAGTRAQAVAQGACEGAVDFGLREWLGELPARHGDARLVTFDTRVGKVRHLPGSAARSAARSGRKHGFTAAEHPESFWVEDTGGPLLPGEIERATAWGRHLGTLMGTS